MEAREPEVAAEKATPEWMEEQYEVALHLSRIHSRQRGAGGWARPGMDIEAFSNAMHAAVQRGREAAACDVEALSQATTGANFARALALGDAVRAIRSSPAPAAETAEPEREHCPVCFCFDGKHAGPHPAPSPSAPQPVERPWLDALATTCDRIESTGGSDILVSLATLRTLLRTAREPSPEAAAPQPAASEERDLLARVAFLEATVLSEGAECAAGAAHEAIEKRVDVLAGEYRAEMLHNAAAVTSLDTRLSALEARSPAPSPAPEMCENCGLHPVPCPYCCPPPSAETVEVKREHVVEAIDLLRRHQAWLLAKDLELALKGLER